MKTPVAIIGSGNIGTDLMFKILRLSTHLEVFALVGIDPESDGLKRAQRMGVAITSEGVEGLVRMPGFDRVKVVFDATSAGAHMHNAKVLAEHDVRLIDLTPAALGPFVVPSVNLEEHLAEKNINMVTCGGQATVPIVAAISSQVPVRYAEIVASIASRSAGPGTRANIDEFTETTAAALRKVGKAGSARAIIILNPAEPPMIMRDTVLVVTEHLDEDLRAQVTSAVEDMVVRVASFVPGYRLKQEVQFADIPTGTPLHTLCNGSGQMTAGGTERYTRVSVFLEVEGAAHYLPAYAGNLDIMTSAALQAAERIVSREPESLPAAAAVPSIPHQIGARA